MKHEFIELGPLTPLHLLLTDGGPTGSKYSVIAMAMRANYARFAAAVIACTSRNAIRKPN
jgi:hypothetical protein